MTSINKSTPDWQVKATRLLRLIRKELSEILRDRRTIITLVMMPLLLYPLLSVAFQQFLLASDLATDTKKEFSVDSPNKMDLNQLDMATLTESLKKAFAGKDLSLTDKATVKVKRPGSSWLITDRDPNSGETSHFAVRYEEDALNIYKKEMLSVGFFTKEEGLLFSSVISQNVDRDQLLEFPIAVYENPKRVSPESLRQKLLMGELDLIIHIPKVNELPIDFFTKDRSWDFQLNLLYTKEFPRSLEAATLIEQLINQANAKAIKKKIGPVLSFQKKLSKKPPEPFPNGRNGLPLLILQPNVQEITVPEREDELPFASILPLILILMTITGAVYPAIDLTAGERERGTLEILVAAPVPRLGLLFAKYVTVLTVAVLTALVNLVSMTFTIWTSGLGSVLFGESGISFVQIAEIFGLLLLFAAFFSAVLLTVTSFARSFKEAQAYLIPLMLMSLAPGVAGMIPGLELSPLLCLVPLLNIVLLSRDLFQNEATLFSATIVVLSTLSYAIAAIALAARAFGSENVLYNDNSGWSDLFRRPLRPTDRPSLASALVCLGLLFSGFFVVQGFLVSNQNPTQLSDPQLVWQIYLMAGLSVLIFALLPTISGYMQKVRFSPGFNLRPASILSFLGAVFLGISLWLLVNELFVLLSDAGLTTMSESMRETIEEKLARVRKLIPVAAMILVLVLPGVVEELFFRGFLFSALRGYFNGPATVIISALLFGLAHWVITPMFGLEKMIVSTFLGLILGWVALQSGSVYPPMLLHALHNGILATLNSLKNNSEDSTSAELEHLPLVWLVIAVVVASLGALFVFLGRTRKKPPEPVTDTTNTDPIRLDIDEPPPHSYSAKE